MASGIKILSVWVETSGTLPEVEPLGDGVHDRLCGDIKFWIEIDYQVRQITVPKGFITDWASIPPIASWIISKRGPHDPAALLHDWLYRVKPPWCSRRTADLLFNTAMDYYEVAGWKRAVMFRAVRVFGERSWATLGLSNEIIDLIVERGDVDVPGDIHDPLFDAFSQRYAGAG